MALHPGLLLVLADGSDPIALGEVDLLLGGGPAHPLTEGVVLTEDEARLLREVSERVVALEDEQLHGGVTDPGQGPVQEGGPGVGVLGRAREHDGGEGVQDVGSLDHDPAHDPTVTFGHGRVLGGEILCGQLPPEPARVRRPRPQPPGQDLQGGPVFGAERTDVEHGGHLPSKWSQAR